MANEQNLIPISEVNSRRTREEHSRDSAKAGKKSGEVRRKKKAMKDTMQILLSLPLPDCKGKDELNNLGINEEDMNIQTVILMAQVQKAMKGNLESAKFVRDVSESVDKTNEDEKETQSIADVIQQAYEGINDNGK